MNKKIFSSSFLPFILLLGFLLIVYRAWVYSGALVGGDLGYIFNEQFSSYTLIPPAWQALYNLGYPNTALIWTGILQHFYINTVGNFLDYTTITRFGFLLPLLVLGSVSIWLLTKEIVTKRKLFLSISVIVYMTNSYILMAAGGGQILIGLSYAIAPLVLLRFINLINALTEKDSNKKLTAKLVKLSLVAGLTLSIQMYFDVRFVYITLLCIFLYFLLHMKLKFHQSSLVPFGKLIFYTFFIPLGLLFMLHAVWIIPTALFRQNPIQELGSAYNSLAAVKFFSFAQFENSISLLHPNWPENIFGKVGFMKAEFLFIPLFAFGSLLFIAKARDPRGILFFVFLGLIGAFLAKGANEPFGALYLWFFDNIPGFVMFRDPSKFYLIVALSYAVLIPFGLLQIYERFKSVVSLTPVVVFLLVWCFTIYPVLSGSLGGTLKSREVPLAYRELKDYLHTQPAFFRTLWIPQLQRFGYYSNNHPGVMGVDMFAKYSLKDLIQELSKPQSEKILQEAGIKYVIVPSDTEQELFIEDRKYSPKYDAFARAQLKKIPWLTYERNIGGNDIFRVKDVKDRFWLANDNANLTWKAVSPSHYQVKLKTGYTGTLIFSEAYDNRWKASFSKTSVAAQRFHNKFNSFPITNSSEMIDIYYEPQQVVSVASFISGGTALVLGVLLLFLRKKKH